MAYGSLPATTSGGLAGGPASSARRSQAWSAEDVCKRGDRAFARWGNVLQYWQACAELFYPERADFTTRSVPGDERYFDIFDEEPMILRRNLANQLGAMLRPRGRDWFMAKAYPRQLNKDDSVRMWCEDASETIRDIIYASGTNFTTAFSQSDNDYVAFGTAIMTHTYNRDRTGLIFECLHPRDCAWEENSDGVIDVMHQRWRRTLAQIDDMGFVIPAEWAERYRNNPQEEVEIRRCVYPIEYADDGAGEGSGESYGSTRVGRSRPPRDAKYVSMYVGGDCRKELKTKSGQKPFFRTWPFLVRRWSTVSGEPFGRSPCVGVALATARMLNQAGLSIIESLEKLVNPPLLAPNDGIVGEVQIRAGGMTYYDAEIDYGSREPVSALQVGRPDFGMEFADSKRLFLARAFLQDTIRFPDTSQAKTAFEVSKLWEQYMRDAAPVFEPMEAENSALMEGVFERIMDADGPGKWGGFDPPPEALEGAEVKFEFETPLNEAYRRLHLEKATEANAYLQSRIALNPGIVDLVDQDEIDGEALRAILPAKAMRPMDEVQETRDRKQATQAMTQVVNSAMAAASGGKPGAPGTPAIASGDPVGDALAGVSGAAPGAGPGVGNLVG